FENSRTTKDELRNPPVHREYGADFPPGGLTSGRGGLTYAPAALSPTRPVNRTELIGPEPDQLGDLARGHERIRDRAPVGQRNRHHGAPVELGDHALPDRGGG